MPGHCFLGMGVAVVVVGSGLSITSAAWVLSAASRGPISESTQAPAFVTMFDRVLVAGFLGDSVSDRGHHLDTNQETARLLATALRSRTSLNVIDSPPIHLRQVESPDESMFKDVAFWKRLGEEYREPLIVTGTVHFRRAGSQSAARQIGPRTVTVFRPRFTLTLRLVFISGRTGEVLDALQLGPEIAADERASALALYLELMDRLLPEAMAMLGMSARSDMRRRDS
jgi:hypothetical protein